MAARLDGFVADLFSLIEIAQSRTRDTQARSQEQTARSHSNTAREAQEQRIAQTEQAAADRARAAEAGGIGDILKIVGVALAVVVGAVGSIVTGGASLVAALALAVGVIGPLVMSALADEGVIQPEIAAGIGIGIAAVCAVVSFGAGAGNLASAVVNTAAETVKLAASALQAAAQIGQGITQIDVAVLGRDATMHDLSALEQSQRRDAERELESDALEQLTGLARAFSRVSQSLAECREESHRAARIAIGRA